MDGCALAGQIVDAVAADGLLLEQRTISDSNAFALTMMARDSVGCHCLLSGGKPRLVSCEICLSSTHISLDMSRFFNFSLCLTEGYEKGYISLYHFENCGFLRKRE